MFLRLVDKAIGYRLHTAGAELVSDGEVLHIPLLM